MAGLLIVAACWGTYGLAVRPAWGTKRWHFGKVAALVYCLSKVDARSQMPANHYRRPQGFFPLCEMKRNTAPLSSLQLFDLKGISRLAIGCGQIRDLQARVRLKISQRNTLCFYY